LAIHIGIGLINIRIPVNSESVLNNEKVKVVHISGS